MSQFTSQWLLEYQRRNAPRPENPDAGDGVDLEVRELHRPILEWCRNQIPEIPVIYSRPNVATTTRIGVQDFTIFYGQEVFCIECKRRLGKLDKDQQTWSYLMERQGFVVHIVRSFEQFLELIKA